MHSAMRPSAAVWTIPAHMKNVLWPTRSGAGYRQGAAGERGAGSGTAGHPPTCDDAPDDAPEEVAEVKHGCDCRARVGALREDVPTAAAGGASDGACLPDPCA